jgi:hypothetical protein
MPRTLVRQATQIRSSDLFDDTIQPSLANYETNSVSVESDLNSLRSAVQNILNRNGASFPTGDWWGDLVAPVNFENGAARGTNALNQQLHDLERKRVLVAADKFLTDITVPATQNYVILAALELPQNTTAAVGSVTTRGTVVAYVAGFGAHDLAEVTGSSAISPKNLCQIVDAVTHDPILSSGRTVYALLQSESNTDGSTLTGVTPNRAQLSFVRLNAAGTDLEAVPVADIENKVVHYAASERKALEDLSEQDFLRGAVTDVPASAVVTRQVAYDNQGTTPVELTTNATLDLNAPGIAWTVRDQANANLFRVVEGSAGGTSQVVLAADVDTFDSSAIVNDFDRGIRVATGTTRINVGETAGVIESVGATADLRILAARELFLDDVNQVGSTWTGSDGVKLSDATAEWNEFKTKYGEVSLLAAINRAYQAKARGTKVYATLTTNVTADTDVGGVGGGANLSAQLPDMSLGSFLTDYDVFVNGSLKRPGADNLAGHDYYPGTSLANGQLRFTFALKSTGGAPDVICVVPHY